MNEELRKEVEKYLDVVMQCGDTEGADGILRTYTLGLIALSLADIRDKLCDDGGGEEELGRAIFV